MLQVKKDKKQKTTQEKNNKSKGYTKNINEQITESEQSELFLWLLKY